MSLNSEITDISDEQKIGNYLNKIHELLEKCSFLLDKKNTFESNFLKGKLEAIIVNVKNLKGDFGI